MSKSMWENISAHVPRDPVDIDVISPATIPEMPVHRLHIIRVIDARECEPALGLVKN